MQRLEVSGAVRPIYGSLGVKRLIIYLDRRGTRLQNEELPDLCSPPDIVQIIKPRRMGLWGHVALLGREEAHLVLVREP